MKVGTDGVLLGAWAKVQKCREILDVGTGTGLVALMAAQRSDACVTGVDIEPNAVEQARENMEASPWADRLEVVEADFGTWTTDKRFDAILCNPPYFADSLKCPDGQRTLARHADALPLEVLARGAAQWLTQEGTLSVVLPVDRTMDMVVAAAQHGLFEVRHTVVYPKRDGKPKRVLLSFARNQDFKEERNALCIEEAPRAYTPEFVALVKDFYLQF